MLNKIDYTIVVIVGILLLLPLLGVDALGTLVEGAMAWIFAIAVIVIGVHGFIKAKNA